MEIKNIVEELCSSGSRGRIGYIKSYLKLNGIGYKEQLINNHIKNIEVTIEGEDNSREILFLAHHDIAPQTNEGANDNSSSVAVLLQSALRLQNSSPPPCKIKLVFNDTEEILGGLLNRTINKDRIKEIIINSGAFQYLKHHPEKEQIEAIYILELCGIGDSLFIAESSGNIICDNELNSFLESCAEKEGFRHTRLPLLSSDMIGVNLCALRGTVLGAVPYHEARAYLQDYKKGGGKKIIYSTVPAAWKNIHTPKDNLFAINERALNMIYRFIGIIIDNS